MNLNEIYEQAEREDKLVAVVKYPYQKPEVVTIDKGLAPIQKTVGGNIEFRLRRRERKPFARAGQKDYELFDGKQR